MSRPGPRNAEDRLRQLLVMLPWLMEAGEVPLTQVASRYGLTETQVAKDLELVAMCGLPPYVDEMIDVFVDDGTVYVGVPRLFTRPLRLTAPEGFALLAAGRAAMELPGADPEGPLARGLAKLADGLGRAGVAAHADDTAGVAVDLERPAATAAVLDAVGTGSELEIEYYSPVRGDVGARTIVPRHVFVDGGNWYVLADDDRSGERRTFRIDRIESMEPTGRLHDLDPEARAPDAFFADVDVPRARLRLRPAASWVVERYPVDSVEPVPGGDPSNGDDGPVEVVLPVASDWWLSRLLVRLGPDATVVDPPDASHGARELASRILAGYDSAG
ncbi:helix-turn-helix transcriptional regulator [Ilumatobacter sp.]|uniref:helix-turn-helix transcriptional regulator n=1 Tax=Ilumatobacter sp. TaxID=1967498 RepID=UPI003B51EB9D